MSRPSIGPPDTPLPSLPKTRPRKSSVSSITSLPTPSTTTARAVSSSLPKPKPTSAISTSSIPTVNTPNPSAPSLRKTVSIGAFPKPPSIAASRGASHPPSPLSAGSPSAEQAPPKQRLSSGARGVPVRDSSLKSNGSRLSSRSASRTHGSPSLLNGSDRSIPALPSSSPSPRESYMDDGEEEARGRKMSNDDTANSEKNKGNVLVSVRVRPDAAKQDNKSDLEWMVDGRRSLVSYKGREGGEYIYDNVFTTHDNNYKVYDSAAKRLVRRVMEGYHGTVFAYGMTGTGKTFSMQGTATSPGVIPLAITDIFSFIRETPHREFLLRVSYLEIYNEKINDLLAASTMTGPNGQPQPQEEIKLREDSKRGVYATPLKEEIVQSPTQLLRVIARGDQARRVAGTQFNARSSRSHAVVQIVVESRERQPGAGSMQENKRQAITPGGVRVSTLSLIDLAGSERAAENKERRTEGAHINKSLLTLGTVIARLSGEKDKQGKDKTANTTEKDKHLPYRDSKLTRLLQGALSGGALVSILCTIQIGSTGSVATASSHTGETLNTLKFASRAKNNIVSHAKKAEEAQAGDPNSRALLDKYRNEIADLRKQLELQNTKTAAEKDEEEEKARELEAEQRHEEQMLEMQLARTALKERIEHLNRLILSSKSLGVNSGRSFSSLSMQRGSMMSQMSFQDPLRSARSSAATLDAYPMMMNRNSSVASFRSSFRDSSATTHTITGAVTEAGSEEDLSLGDNGDGTATLSAQVRSLQADLADKNRYISTLEKRLLQARRSSHSRVSMSFARGGNVAEGSTEELFKEKDTEIADLRARLDDKDKMMAALRSAARKRDIADLPTLDTTHMSSTTPPDLSRRSSRHRSNGSNNSSNPKASPMSPVSVLAPVPPPSTATGAGADRRKKSVDEVTKMLDELIDQKIHAERVDSGIVVRNSQGATLGVGGGKRQSISRVVSSPTT
ncbi:kinesin-domain-containing protein [Aulographum hederae CBS 113979]|uniref:Kinesin-like protein n=1 Tax=Aulographum hederae CBS 113979 TaxID=1176131 RepID=A0A6G1H349_9PEZI|nr:kinesin-domain-containing protein [Aulographum hederae CBS 113979]